MKYLTIIFLIIIGSTLLIGCSQRTEFDSCTSVCKDTKRPCLVSESIITCINAQNTNQTLIEYCFNECKQK